MPIPARIMFMAARVADALAIRLWDRVFHAADSAAALKAAVAKAEASK